MVSPSSTPPKSSAANAYLLLTLTPLLWSISWILGRGLATDIPPMAMTFYRWLFSGLILAPFAWPKLRRDWPLVRKHWKALLFLAAVGIASHNGLAYLGLNYTTATNGVILNSFIPVMIVALSWIFLRDPLSPLQMVGLGISLSGVLAILSQGSFDTLLAFRLNVGDVIIIVSMAMWAVYTICLRWQPQGMHGFTLLFVLICLGVACVFPFFVVEALWVRTMAFTPSNLAALLTVALFSSVLAYIFWNRGVEQIGANVAGLFVHLMPVYGVVLAWMFLGETLALYHLIGISLILAGIWITSRAGRRPVPAPAPID